MKFEWLLAVAACLMATQRASGYRSLQTPSRRLVSLFGSSEGYDKMTVVELKEALKERGLAISGLKQILIERLKGMSFFYNYVYVVLFIDLI
jgi:hypothetical protein